MPRDFVDFLKSKISIVDVVARRIKLKKSGKDFIGLCPFHSEKTPSFRLDPDRGVYHCFGCGAGGDVISFMMEYEKISFPEALERLASTYGIPLPKKDENENQIAPHLKVYSALDVIKDWFAAKLSSPGGETARRYLVSRKISEVSIKKFQLGYCDDNRGLLSYLKGKGFTKETLLKTGVFSESMYHGDLSNRFDGRLMFPILDASGRCIGFGGRVVRETDAAKYINSPESEIFAKRNHLYGYSLARRGKTRNIIMVEGYLDVVSMHQAGFDGAVAPLGTAISEQQISMCWKIIDTPVMALDGDSAGTKAAYRFVDRLLPLISPGKSFKFARFPQGADPDSVISSGQMDVLNDAINNAIPLSQWLWEGSFLLYPSETPEQKAAVIKTIREKINLIQDRSIKNLYIQELRDRERNLARRKNNFQPKWLNIRPIAGVTAKIEKILIVTLINHPHIIDRVVEDLVKLEFKDIVMRNLKDNMLEYYGTYYLNGKSEKYAALACNLAEVLKEQPQDIELHAGFISMDASDDEALSGWRQIYEKYYSDFGIREDLQNAAHRLESSFTESDWQRLRALKKEVLPDSVKKRGKQ
ncbi:MAG: DNA primase [Holosporaceae bacterium]|jgi:DNA primase|nr:DNA primase [Holosporaceae bacterium]